MGNLSLDTTADDVLSAFLNRGLEVKEVFLAKDSFGKLRGFGFIEFTTEADAAKAIALKDVRVKARTVRLDYASQ